MSISPFILQHLVTYFDDRLPEIESSKAVIEFGTFIYPFLNTDNIRVWKLLV